MYNYIFYLILYIIYNYIIYDIILDIIYIIMRNNKNIYEYIKGQNC